MITLTARLITAAVVAAGALALPVPADAQAPQRGSCQYEDGNTDGTACLWTDPDTGIEFDVDSRNYVTR
ncbi:hypothetical protein [Mycolicibacterium diernhoferi]|uniref:hypothetical protein n=1 Tax=Mycolicibacterium diernhoferi TaxID=1801 RepID=UPI000939DAB9|nr:hypothetical protein [Mycolicibacterium diernhoferi]QYL25850.1 hypothetical protein K0O62_20200 [Mycolicibacterium diernhoferi]